MVASRSTPALFMCWDIEYTGLKHRQPAQQGVSGGAGGGRSKRGVLYFFTLYRLNL